jgi:hypothetical protein
MIRRTWIACLFASALAVAGVAGRADAGLLPVSVTVQPEAGNFRWTYSVVLPTNMQLQSGSYFTIYDFAGYQPGSAMVTAAGPATNYSQYWTASSSMTGPTPSGLFPTDSATTPNVTFTYNGPTIPSGQLTLGNFVAVSTYGTTTTGSFTAINPRAIDGIPDANLTSTLVPQGGSSTTIGTPEPATLVLAGLGLPLVGFARVLRRKGGLAPAAVA